jgi:hypothetical protein
MPALPEWGIWTFPAALALEVDTFPSAWPPLGWLELLDQS